MQTKAQICTYIYKMFQENYVASTQLNYFTLHNIFHLSHIRKDLKLPLGLELKWVEVISLNVQETSKKRAFLSPDIIIVCHHFTCGEAHRRICREEEVAGEDGRFITTASVTRNNPLSNNRELLQLFLFLSFLIPKLSHSLTLHLVTWILWQPLSDVLPYSLSPSTLYALFPVLCHLSAASIPSMLTASTSFTVILTVMMSLHRSFHLSFTCFLSQAGCQSHAVILNDSLSSHFFLQVLTP